MQITSMLSAGYLEPSRSFQTASQQAAQRAQQNTTLNQDIKTKVASGASDAAALAKQEQSVLSQEQALRAKAGAAEVQTVYHYAMGSDGRRYITGASVTLKGEEQDLNRVGGGVSTKDVQAQAKDDESTRKVSGAEDKAGSRRSDDAAKDSENGLAGDDLSEGEEAMVRELEQAQREVVAHEAAHQAAAGALGGGVSFSYTQGPDGKSYITGGEVPIQLKQGATPEETLRNMQQVQRAANAPADPSGQDRRVAAQAASLAAEARQEISAERAEEAESASGAPDGEGGPVSLVAKGTPVLNAWGQQEEDPSKNGVASVLASIRASQVQAQLMPAA